MPQLPAIQQNLYGNESDGYATSPKAQSQNTGSGNNAGQSNSPLQVNRPQGNIRPQGQNQPQSDGSKPDHEIDLTNPSGNMHGGNTFPRPALSQADRRRELESVRPYIGLQKPSLRERLNEVSPVIAAENAERRRRLDAVRPPNFQSLLDSDRAKYPDRDARMIDYGEKEMPRDDDGRLAKKMAAILGQIADGGEKKDDDEDNNSLDQDDGHDLWSDQNSGS